MLWCALAQFLLWNNAFWGLDKMFHEMYAPSYKGQEGGDKLLEDKHGPV